MSYNYFNSLFGSTSSENGMYSIFSGSNGVLGDYAMIKSGVYKKLLTAYYKTQDSTGNTDETASVEDTTEKAKLVTVKTDSNTLMEAADKLNDTALYKSTGKDEAGKAVYDTEAIKDNVKAFVSAYNSFIDSTSDVDNVSVLNKSLSVVKETASNRNLLKEVGITIGEGNKLSVDEETLASAKMTTLTSLFTGRNSYASDITQKASETYKLAYSASYNASGACSYTYSGKYSSLGSVSSVMDKYL